EPEWVEHDYPALGDLVQLFANAKFQQADIDNVIAACHPHPVAKVADTFRRITAAAHPAYGRHTRVVPSADVAFVYQAEKLTLGHDRVVHVESCELILPGGIDIELLYEPVVQLPVWNELQGTDAVGNFFDGVGLAMRKVVHRINAPLVAGSVMVRVLDAIHNRVAHVHIGVSHVDLGAEYLFAVLELAGPHVGKQGEIFLDTT